MNSAPLKWTTSTSSKTTQPPPKYHVVCVFCKKQLSYAVSGTCKCDFLSKTLYQLWETINTQYSFIKDNAQAQQNFWSTLTMPNLQLYIPFQFSSTISHRIKNRSYSQVSLAHDHAAQREAALRSITQHCHCHVQRAHLSFLGLRAK